MKTSVSGLISSSVVVTQTACEGACETSKSSAHAAATTTTVIFAPEYKYSYYVCPHRF